MEKSLCVLMPDAKRVRVMLIVVIKNIDNPLLKKHKARLVLIGCDIRDAEDRKIIERLRHLVPASLGRRCAKMVCL